MTAPFAVVYDAATLEPRMVVAPEGVSELDDEAFNPPGCIQARISPFPFDDYEALYLGAKAALPALKWPA